MNKLTIVAEQGFGFWRCTCGYRVMVDTDNIVRVLAHVQNDWRHIFRGGGCE
jgi:hypothetical protein